MITPKMQLEFFESAVATVSDLVQGMRIMASMIATGAPVVRLANSALDNLNSMHDTFQLIRDELHAEIEAEDHPPTPAPAEPTPPPAPPHS
jgi:hypothetical protein